MKNTLSIHERINFKSWFRPENEDSYFMRINRLNTRIEAETKTETNTPFYAELFLKGWKRTTTVVRRAKF